MGLFDRVERKLESVVNGAFARAFKAEVQPVEIASAMRRAMDDRAAVVSKGRTIVPNLFTIELAPKDYERLISYEETLATELVASVAEHAESQRLITGGPLAVSFTEHPDLETGVFRVRADTAKRIPEAPPAPRPPRSPSRVDDNGAGDEGAAAGAAVPAAQARMDAHGEGAGAAAPHPSAESRPGPDHQPAPDAPRTTLAPAPVPPPEPLIDPADRPWLEIDGDSYPLLGALTVVGRDPSADVTLDDPGISRRHCELRVTHDGPHLRISVSDLGSTNGTFVNGDRVHTRHVENGDRLTVGRLSLYVRTGRK